MNAIFKRRAVREYTSEKIDDEKIQKLIDAFQAAPCALHQTEVMELSVITDPELLKKIEDNTNNSCYNAPLIFMINTKKDSQFGERDASAAAENVMVEAFELGLASVYVMGGVSVLNKFPEIQKELGMDDGYETSVLLPIGYPADDGKPEDRSNRYKVVRK
ncbi:nitroreductase family protein [Lactobacillus hominis]|uniref:Nitroreductase n=1 Tax=Lactobacillus hominis DSM 23910 = CRBIP 24.179 TaxID=1423758 RepID=I7L4Z7_9LACO|nr:nitroreductase family protein [Lactobacillus hominis]KRM85958.1 nitroreductase [Lactobacillus hominis DSM 23910 = CRBIP 24.179]MCT3348812.1 nitroreductase [Lactobacillus hominis]CCI81087.1 Nitroreductase [Lactobacillus hominis DSM 23910 = CRBIP 24.179]